MIFSKLWYTDDNYTYKEKRMNGQTYEKLVKQQPVGRLRAQRIGAIFGYLIWIGIGLTLLLRLGFSLLFLLLFPLSTVILILLTWKYLCVEFEYVLVSDCLFLSKIYGKKTRKAVLEVNLKHLLLAAPCTDEQRSRAEAFSPGEMIHAESRPDSDELWLMVFEGEGGKRYLLYFDADETLIRFLRHANPRAVARDMK